MFSELPAQSHADDVRNNFTYMHVSAFRRVVSSPCTYTDCDPSFYQCHLFCCSKLNLDRLNYWQERLEMMQEVAGIMQSGSPASCEDQESYSECR